MSERKKPLRAVRGPFVVQDRTGVAIRDRLKDLTPQDDQVLRLIGAHMGGLATADLAPHSRAGFERTSQTWATRKQELTAGSSSRWAGAVTKGTHDQYALARRGQFAYRDKLADGIRMLMHRLSLPVGGKTEKQPPMPQKDWDCPRSGEAGHRGPGMTSPPPCTRVISTSRYLPKAPRSRQLGKGYLT
ncbi:hypothetical protein [Streptomyces avermitilis]|uniref:hypothetical protein n=1 Tax=Streptomyces avermitilis TaxID=33903 RepID=UPI0036C07D19